MDDIFSKQAVLEVNVANLTKNVDDLAKLIKGNGKPSLDVRLDRIETQLNQLVAIKASSKDTTQRIKERVVAWGLILLISFLGAATWSFLLGSVIS